MTLSTFRSYFTKQLIGIFPQTEIDSFFFLLMEELVELKRIDTVLHPDFKISKDKQEELENALKRLQKEEPIQYILGNTEFYGLPFKVDKNTLIPRPETEELVAWILNTAKKNTQEILDIGTGTGCIAISLAKNLANTALSAIDISENALTMAQKNAALNKVAVSFYQADVLKTIPFKKERLFDIIVSNPPYVRELEKAEIHNNVLQNEPHLALFVTDNNPLVFYDAIAEIAKKHLTKNGLLFFEINQYLGKETIALLKEKGFQNIELRKDFSGNDRMIKVSL